MGEPPLNVLRSAELKRRGIAAVEEALRAGPVHLLKRNRPAAVVLSADDYQRLQRSAAQPDPAGPSCLEWLLELPAAAAGRSRDAIDADLNEQRDW
jgi:prevent-host-death family protein